MFSKHVADKLKFYVYRLIDPRNGETFYVGKGTGNRVFAHIKDELGAEADDLTEKLSRIRRIHLDGFEVAHVIHRHGMSEDQAFEVEAALIDVYPEAANQIAGKASDERGLMHANQIVERYEAQEAVFQHALCSSTLVGRSPSVRAFMPPCAMLGKSTRRGQPRRKSYLPFSKA